MMNKYLNEFVKCLDEKRYYDAHEALEIVWFPKRFEDCKETKLLKGFINAAVSLELDKRGKKLQSEKVWTNYLKYNALLNEITSPYLERYHHISRYLQSIKNKNLLITH